MQVCSVNLFTAHHQWGCMMRAAMAVGGETDGRLRVIISCALEERSKENLTYAPPARR